MRPIRTSIRMGDKVRQVSVERSGNTAKATVDGREYRLSILESRPGVYSIVPAESGGASTEAVVRELNGSFQVRVSNRIFEASIEGPGGRAGRSAERAGGKGAKVLKALMPGRVVRLLVDPGARVERGQGLLVIEAMKMENELGSPREGKVKEFKVAADDRVETGTDLVVIE